MRGEEGKPARVLGKKRAGRAKKEKASAPKVFGVTRREPTQGGTFQMTEKNGLLVYKGKEMVPRNQNTQVENTKKLKEEESGEFQKEKKRGRPL